MAADLSAAAGSGRAPTGSAGAGASAAVRFGEPILRWSSRAHSVAEVESELARIWAVSPIAHVAGGEGERRIAARTSVLNLVAIARRAEVAERCAATIAALTSRHPSRSLILAARDPDGPSWLDARVEARCVLPHEDAAEQCSELVFVQAGGDAGRHLAAIVAPLLIHDLPVTLWWPDEVPLGTRPVDDLLATTDRLVVDGSSWTGDGLVRLRRLAELAAHGRVLVSDFALMRQARWREAIASVFDLPEIAPFLRSIRRVVVTYATHDGPDALVATNMVKPVYHVAWFASRLGWVVDQALRTPAAGEKDGTGGGAPVGRRAAILRRPRGEVLVVLQPVASQMTSGTTLRFEVLAERSGHELLTEVTAAAEAVEVRVWLDGAEHVRRTFRSPRRDDVGLLAQTIESGGRDRVSDGAIAMAAELVGEPRS